MTSQFDIDAAWRDHEAHPQLVADRVGTALGSLSDATQRSAALRLWTHLYAEHLPDQLAGIDLLRSLPSDFAPPTSGFRTVAVAIATLQLLGDRPEATQDLSREESAAAQATAASALAARGRIPDAVLAYQAALRLAEMGLPDGSPALRALAASGNNLAVTLEELPVRDADEVQAMLLAAQCALTYWRRAGGWLEEERACYRLACSFAVANRPLDAVRCAEQCAAICEENSAPPFECFHAFAQCAVAHRLAGQEADAERCLSKATQALAMLEPEARAACRADYAALWPHDAPGVAG